MPCGPVTTVETINFALSPGSARPFLERIGSLKYRRSVGALIAPGEFRVHTYPLNPPFPLPELETAPGGSGSQTTIGWPS